MLAIEALRIRPAWNSRWTAVHFSRDPFEKPVEIGGFKLPSYSIRDADPPSQFAEVSSFGYSNDRADAVRLNVLAISRRVYGENRAHDALA